MNLEQVRNVYSGTAGPLASLNQARRGTRRPARVFKRDRQVRAYRTVPCSTPIPRAVTGAVERVSPSVVHIEVHQKRRADAFAANRASGKAEARDLYSRPTA